MKNMQKIKVVFNGDSENFEEFEKLEDAEKFASRYANAKVQYEEKHIESILKKEEKDNAECIRLGL
jgi:hypothetical protein